MNVHVDVAHDMRPSSILESQRAAFLRDGAPSYEARVANLAKLRKAILAHRKEIEAAIHADFGNRSTYETALMEIMPIIGGIDYLRAHLRRWMRPKARHVALQFRPGTAKILTQPLGIIGIIAPWNYPASLSLIPLATALAAGNRAMIKPSEYSPKTSALLATLLGGLFSSDEVAVVTGGPEVGAAFSELAFDHLMFTGSTGVGRAVMQAASKNLVPVTLELGGKSPVIVDQGFDPSKAAKSIVFGKLSNAGQTCIAPDYALVHESDLEAFVAAFTAATRAAYPAGATDDAYGSIISPRHHDRLVGLVDDAPPERRQGRRNRCRAGREPPAHHRANAHPRRHARDEGDAGGNLRADPAYPPLSHDPRGDRPRQRRPAPRLRSTYSATRRPSSTTSSPARRAAT